MKTTNQTSKEKTSTKAAALLKAKTQGPQTHAKSLVAQLIRDGARVFSNGSSSYLVMGNEIMELEFYDLDNIQLFLETHNYLDPDVDTTKTFWGAFLDTALASHTILLQAFLWEQGNRRACCDITWSVTGGIEASKKSIMDVIERYGSTLTSRA